jgi:hypothetical protein
LCSTHYFYIVDSDMQQNNTDCYHYSSGYANAPHCYVMRILSVLLGYKVEVSCSYERVNMYQTTRSRIFIITIVRV